MENLNNCPQCGNSDIDVIYPTSPLVSLTICNRCGYSICRKKEKKMSKYVIIRDDNNRVFESCEQAVLVAEKLARETPNHIYYVAKLIKESKLANAITTDLE